MRESIKITTWLGKPKWDIIGNVNQASFITFITCVC